MSHVPIILTVVTLGFGVACDPNQRTPSAPPVPDIDLPKEPDLGFAKALEERDPDAGPTPMEDSRAPIAVNLIEFVPAALDGVPARRRTTIKTAPIVHGFYQGEKRRVYNLEIAGPKENESARRAKYVLLGKEESTKSGPVETKGLKLGEFDAQRTYHAKKQRSETVVLVNPFVQVKLSVAPTKDADESTKLLGEVDLAGISKLR